VCPHAQIREDKTIRCVLAHEVALLRQGVKRLLEDEDDFKVVAEAGNAAEMLRAISEYSPDVVIADLQVLGCPASQAEQMILRESPKSRVIFLSARSASEFPVNTSHRTKYVLRHTAADELVGMVRSAGTEEVGEAGEVSEFPSEESGSRKRVLTAREQEVLKLLAEGRTVRSVAGILGLSVKTVDAHKFNLMRKLGIHNKAELVMWAIQKKVLKLPVNF